jgi:hypothetical protein
MKFRVLQESFTWENSKKTTRKLQEDFSELEIRMGIP